MHLQLIHLQQPFLFFHCFQERCGVFLLGNDFLFPGETHPSLPFSLLADVLLLQSPHFIAQDELLLLLLPHQRLELLCLVLSLLQLLLAESESLVN